MEQAMEITKFCATADPRAYLHKPMRHDGYLYATNGHIAVRIADDPAIDAGPMPTRDQKTDWFVPAFWRMARAASPVTGANLGALVVMFSSVLGGARPACRSDRRGWPASPR